MLECLCLHDCYACLKNRCKVWDTEWVCLTKCYWTGNLTFGSKRPVSPTYSINKLCCVRCTFHLTLATSFLARTVYFFDSFCSITMVRMQPFLRNPLEPFLLFATSHVMLCVTAKSSFFFCNSELCILGATSKCCALGTCRLSIGGCRWICLHWRVGVRRGLYSCRAWAQTCWPSSPSCMCWQRSVAATLCSQMTTIQPWCSEHGCNEVQDTALWICNVFNSLRIRFDFAMMRLKCTAT